LGVTIFADAQNSNLGSRHCFEHRQNHVCGMLSP